MGLPAQDDRNLLVAFRQAVLDKIRRDLARERAEADALRARIVPLVRAAVESVRAEQRCGRVWLFGSFASGQPGARSDIDLLVEGDDREVAYRVGAACGLEVHAVAIDEADETLRQRCESDGVKL